MDIVNPESDLKIGISPKGTKYVTARNLHAALRLNHTNYARDVKGWLQEDYGFPDDIRPPREGAQGEYSSYTTSTQVKGGQASQDYFLKLSLAKLITLNSNSPVKKEYARYLLSLEQQVEDADLLSPKQVVALIEVAKVMGMISSQKAAERQHYSAYMTSGGKLHKWVSRRATLLGYTTDTLRDAMLKVGMNAARRNHRVMLIQSGDSYKTIRAGVIDLFAALGKTDRYAQNMGELAYTLAKEIKVVIWDDRNIPIDFSTGLDQDLVKEIAALQKDGFMGLW